MNFNIDDVIVFNDGEYLILDVIRENNIPSILIEFGFMNSYNDRIC